MLERGLYDKVIDAQLRSDLLSLTDAVGRENGLDTGDSHAVLAKHMVNLLSRALAALPVDDKLNKQIEICNQVINTLAAANPKAVKYGKEAIDETGKKLLEIASRQPDGTPRWSDRCETPLSESCLLTGTRADPSLASQLKHELRTADRVDILCAFVMWGGLRVLADDLRAFAARPNTELRVITTSYMGNTDPRAVKFLSELSNAKVKIAYGTGNDRLHAKAYVFRRKSGFGSAYVGSSNLSKTALTDGLEWNMKVSQYEAPDIWDKIVGTFETYWNDANFTSYTSDDDHRLREALKRERPGGERGISFHFDIKPHDFQEVILDRLEVERKFAGRNRNLIIAATGTGKTVIAAFDYKRCRAEWLKEAKTARLLFVAHREEILKQSLDCFRLVQRNQNFGSLLVGNFEPNDFDHLFVSIQSYNSRQLYETTSPDYYDFVVIDEFHHAGAEWYKNLLLHIKPRILLGLTATPERSDGQDILKYFDNHISAEIRLPRAINDGLLCKFQYFGITDSVDLTGLTWQRGGYVVSELDDLLIGNDGRADLVVRTVADKVLDPLLARGLGFCSSIRHAEYMAEYFTRAGIPSEAVSANSSDELRNSAKAKLVDRQINFVFTVDLYNEGVDIPEVDTVLFLRPTDSLTVFLQQLGRGLRKYDGKDCLVVLDFIAAAHRNYNFEMRYRALMDAPKKRVDKEIQDGCPHVPLGCSIQLERVAQERILQNISQSFHNAKSNLIQRIAGFEVAANTKPTLRRFLEWYEMEPADLYQRGSWTALCAAAGVAPPITDPDQDRLAKGLRRLAHINGPAQIERLLVLLNTALPESLNLNDQRLLTMLHLTLWGDWQPVSIAASIARLQQNPQHFQELLELLDCRRGKAPIVPPDLTLPYVCPMELYCSYTRDEILGALGYWDLIKRPAVREGVLAVHDLKTDIFFITLNKTEKNYSPTTMYEDYATSPELFHWQSQSITSSESKTGQRYIHHQKSGNTVLLFVRENQTENGIAAPYEFLGPATYLSHTGSRPMSIIWRLHYPIPAKLIGEVKRLAIA